MSRVVRFLLAATLVLLLGQATGGEPAGPKDPEIDRLIKQLGSDSFEEREAASRKLEEIGELALPALHKEVGSQDAEIRRRALKLGNLFRSRIDAKKARQIIEKGIKALGGEEKLDRYKALTFRGKATWYSKGRPDSAWTGECIARFPFQHRTTFKPAEGIGRTQTTVLNGDKGWWKTGIDSTDIPPAFIANYRESLHAEVVATLTPLLKDKRYTLSLLGEAKVGGSDALGVMVGHKDHRDVKLFFDKRSGLLLKYERLVKTDGTEKAREIFQSDYQDFSGIRRPRKLVFKSDEEEECVWEITEYKALEDVDESEFAKP
jgi:hypothetical protein